jgi:hypothetical protein
MTTTVTTNGMTADARPPGQATARDVLAEAADTWDRLRALLIPYFAELAAGQAYHRHPSLGIVLPFPAEPDHWLRMRPLWRQVGGRQEMDGKGLDLDLVREWVDDRGRLRRGATYCSAPLGLTLLAGKVLDGFWEDGTAYEAQLCRQVVALVREFLADPAAAFRRSANRCCCCLRPLTDPMSRAQGFGPECKARVAYLLWLSRDRQGDPPPAIKRAARKPARGKVLHANEDRTALEYEGAATIVRHRPDGTRREEHVRWFKTEPHTGAAFPYAYVLYKEPQKRRTYRLGYDPESDCHAEILDADGAVLWDSRRVVPSKAEWEAKLAALRPMENYR